MLKQKDETFRKGKGTGYPLVHKTDRERGREEKYTGKDAVERLRCSCDTVKLKKR